MSLSQRDRDELANNFDKYTKYSLDDKVVIGCKSCGLCCKDRKTLIFTSYDIFRIAKYLGHSPGDVIKRYCLVLEGAESHIPLLVANTVPPMDSCPFQRDKKCIVHPAKPLVCRLYPFGKFYSTEPHEDGTLTPHFLLPYGMCERATKTREMTVREWVGDAVSEEADEAGEIWARGQTKLVLGLREYVDNHSKEQVDKLLSRLAYLLYADFDTALPFTPQLTQSLRLAELAIKVNDTLESQDTHDAEK